MAGLFGGRKAFSFPRSSWAVLLSQQFSVACCGPMPGVATWTDGCNRPFSRPHRRGTSGRSCRFSMDCEKEVGAKAGLRAQKVKRRRKKLRQSMKDARGHWFTLPRPKPPPKSCFVAAPQDHIFDQTSAAPQDTLILTIRQLCFMPQQTVDSNGQLEVWQTKCCELEAALQDAEMKRSMAVCLLDCKERNCEVDKAQVTKWKGKCEQLQAEITMLKSKPPENELQVALASSQSQVLQYQQAHSQLTLQLQSFQVEIGKWRQWRHTHQALIHACQIPFPWIGPPYET